MNQNNNNEIILYTVEDIKKMFNIGQTSAYALVNSPGFPSIKINRKILVPKNELEKWLKTYCGKSYYY